MKISAIQWQFLLLLVAGGYATGISAFLYRRTQNLKYLMLLNTAAVFVVFNLLFLLSSIITSSSIRFFLDHIAVWGEICCLALVLSALLLTVRESMPEFSQFPLFYITLPAVILLSYILVWNSKILTNALLRLYEGGALTAALIIYGLHAYRESDYVPIIFGLVLLLLSFFVGLILPVSYYWVNSIIFSAGIIIFFSGYYVIEKTTI